MEIIGVLRHIERLNGTRKDGTKWDGHSIVIEEKSDKYPQSIVGALNPKIDISNLKLGDDVKVQFSLFANEYNGKYYQNIRVWKVEPMLKKKEDDFPF